MQSDSPIRSSDLSNIGSSFQRILITGSTGWLGSEILDIIDLESIALNGASVTFLGSSDRKVSHGNITYKQTSLFEFTENAQFDLIIHCAFLTQDKLQSTSVDEYIRINKDITRKITTLARNGNPSILALSSGAADPLMLKNAKTVPMKVYGELKREMEVELLSAAKNKTLICRIWNVSGRNIQDPLKYALGDFIASAIQGKNITLNSTGQQKRSYIPSSQLFTNLLLQLLKGDSGIYNSGGVECTIKDLAIKVQSLLNVGEGIVSIGEHVEIDCDYVSPNSLSQNSIASGFAREFNLDEQILTTAKSKFFKTLINQV
jgi:nucleoside-diphosphate-sugar epimerase